MLAFIYTSEIKENNKDNNLTFNISLLKKPIAITLNIRYHMKQNVRGKEPFK